MKISFPYSQSPNEGFVGNERSLQWVRQFDPMDRETAADLLQQLQLVGADRFLGDLSSLLDRASGDLEARVATFATREPQPSLPYFKDKRSKPLSTPPAGVGSEGIIANLLTSKRRSDPHQFLDHPAIGALKRARMRHIFLVDNIAGSGKRSKDMIGIFEAHPTLLSWLSYDWIQLHVVCHAATRTALKRLASPYSGKRLKKRRIQIHYNLVCPQLDNLPTALWKRFRALCLKYAERHSIDSRYKLGFGSLATKIVFAHGCPNTAPGILWHRAPQWTPLFPDRTIPSELLRYFESNWSLRDCVDRMNTVLPSANILFQSELQQKKVAVLLAYSKRPDDESQVAFWTNLSRPELNVLTPGLAALGMLDRTRRRLSMRGRRELAQILRGPPERGSRFKFTEESPYYPTSFRGDQGVT